MFFALFGIYFGPGARSGPKLNNSRTPPLNSSRPPLCSSKPFLCNSEPPLCSAKLPLCNSKLACAAQNYFLTQNYSCEIKNTSCALRPLTLPLKRMKITPVQLNTPTVQLKTTLRQNSKASLALALAPPWHKHSYLAWTKLSFVAGGVQMFMLSLRANTMCSPERRARWSPLLLDHGPLLTD